MLASFHRHSRERGNPVDQTACQLPLAPSLSGRVPAFAAMTIEMQEAARG
jgi:hypothetical protein